MGEHLITASPRSTSQRDLHVPSRHDMSESPLAIPLSSVSDSPLDASLRPPPKSHRSADFFDKYLPERYAVFAKNNTGLLFVAASTFFFSCMNLTVKYFLSITSISVVTLIVVRMAITSAGCIIALYFIGDPNYLFGPPEIRNMLAVRGVVGFGGLFSNYQSFKGLSVSDSTAIQFLSPSVTAFLGYMFLAESLSRRELFAGVCCLAGVFLVSRPPFLFGWGNEEILPPEDAGSVVIPGEGVDADITTPERMIAVGWAFAAVASGSTACEFTIPIRRPCPVAYTTHRRCDPIYWR